MKKYNLLLFLFILPISSSFAMAKKRRRPSINHQLPIFDQIAQANTWQSPNRIISASYARNPGTGQVNNANLMINLIPHNDRQYSVDMAASETLSNAQSAAEYVTRALQMRKNLRDKAPHSSYVKYDIYENEERTQHLRPYHDRRLVTQKPTVKSDVVTRDSQIYEDYRRPDYLNDFGEGESMYRESMHKFNGRYNSHNIENLSNLKNDIKELTEAGIPKAELMKHIEKSVVRYMKRLESEGSIPKIPPLRPHTEINTYYRLPAPKLNTDERIKDYTEYQSTESELFKPAPTQYYKTYKSPKIGTLTTISSPYPEETQTIQSIVPNVDLTSRYKRPKPIDYTALDIGQSWSHGSSLDHHVSKPKLKFNSQTYQDINAMTYTPGKGLVRDEPLYVSQASTPCTVSENGDIRTKTRNGGIANVGASITVNDNLNPHNPDEALKDLHDYYRKPLQIINGVPVLNPYKVNADTLKHMFGNDPEQIGKDGWQPYSPPQKEVTSASNAYSQHLPLDSYNPKYNNNPEGQGYQDNWQPPENSHRQRGTIGSEMHSNTPASSIPKKIRNTTTVTIHKHKRKKNKTKRIKITPKPNPNTSPKKNNNLQTELRPPPAQTKT